MGPVFAVAYLLADFGRVKKKFSILHLFFIAASTLTYTLVYWMAGKGWRFENDTLDMLMGSLTAGVVVGSLLLPFVHGILFGVDLGTVRKVSIRLIASWYVTLFLSKIDEIFNIPGSINYAFVAIALWQGIYFRFLKIS